MECKWHPGQEAELTCLECGQQFCRQCVIETRESHHCPECHEAELGRFAARMATSEPKPKPKKEKLPKEPPAPREKKKKEEKKALRKPADGPARAPAPVAKEAPPPPSPSISPDEKKEFWSDLEQPRRAAKRASKKPPPPLRVEGLPPPAADLEKTLPPPRELDKGPRVIPESEKKRIVPDGVREQAVLTAEGFPVKKEEQQEEAELVTGAAGAGVPARGRAKHAARPRKERKTRGEGLVAMQMPDEYDGEITSDPSYLKAVLWGLLIGLAGGAAYGALGWWRHREYGIIGWAIGVAVGVAVVLGSGRHFNWKLGLISAGIAMFFISAGRIFDYWLEVKFPPILKLPFPFWDTVTHSFKQYGRQFLTIWLVFLITTGLVAFLVSFRPWPLKIQASPQAKRVPRPRRA